MKTIVKITLLVFYVLLAKKSTAQFCSDMMLIKPLSTISNGMGYGINFLSTPINLGNEKYPDHLQMRFGAGFYSSKLQSTDLDGVPLNAPQIGNSMVRFKNKIYGFNAITRFSLPYSKKITPYVDLFAGLRDISCNMIIYPDNTDCYSKSTQNLRNIKEFNYGFSCGLLISLSQNIKLDLGLSQSFANYQHDMIDVGSAHLESNSVVLNTMNLPSKILIVKVGLVFHFKNFKELKKSLPHDIVLCEEQTDSPGSGYFSSSSGHLTYNSSVNYSGGPSNTGRSSNNSSGGSSRGSSNNSSGASHSSGGCSGCGSTPHVSVNIRPSR